MSSFARSFPLKGSIRPLSRLMRCAAPRYRAFVSVADTHRKFGDHIDTYYSLTAVNRPMFGPLSHDLDVDVAIIGGGLAGVNCALSLSNRGIKATVLESNTIGWAASGRNGGFVHSGFALNPLSLVKKVGFDTASVMWKLSDKSLDLIRKRINTWSADPAPSAVVGQSPANGIPSGKGCNVLSGMLIGSWFNDPKGIEEEIELCNKLLGKDSFDYRTKEQISEQIGTTKYYDGYFDKNAFHFHTLNYLHNAVWEAKYVILSLDFCRFLLLFSLPQGLFAHYSTYFFRSKGVSFFEKSPVDSIVYQGDKKLLRLANGQTIRCNQVVICGSAYMPNLDSPSPEIRASLQTLTRSVLPVMTYACVTKPLSKELFDSVFKGSEACISDNRFACDYYRPLPATRQILWGGRVDCIGIPNEKIAGALHKDMCKIFPQVIKFSLLSFTVLLRLNLVEFAFDRFETDSMISIFFFRSSEMRRSRWLGLV